MRKKDLRKGKSRIQSNTSNRAYQAIENRAPKHNNESDPEPFALGPVGNTFVVREQRLLKLGTNSTWFLDLCISYHLCNDQTLFSNLKAKSINFVRAVRQLIRIEKIGAVAILLQTTITLSYIILHLLLNMI